MSHSPKVTASSLAAGATSLALSYAFHGRVPPDVAAAVATVAAYVAGYVRRHGQSTH